VAPGNAGLPRQHLVEEAPQGIDVGPLVHRSAVGQLFGAHVGEGAHGDSRAGEALVGLAGGLGDPEVTHQGVAGLEKDVLGLDVTMDETVFVGILEGITYFTGDPHRFIQRKPPLAV
jgi:hypothetical protein